MTEVKQQAGFTTVELLITLFVAAMFIIAGFQLYSVIIKDSGEARNQAQASNVAYDYLQKYKSSATSSCTPNASLYTGNVTVNNLTNATVTVSMSCPYPSLLNITKITSTVKYNDPQQTVSSSAYVAK